MNSDLLNGLNEHLKLEFRASHEYLAMAIWLAEHDLPGFSKWMRKQSSDELMHAQRIIDHLVERDQSRAAGSGSATDRLAIGRSAVRSRPQERAGSHLVHQQPLRDGREDERSSGDADAAGLSPNRWKKKRPPAPCSAASSSPGGTGVGLLMIDQEPAGRMPGLPVEGGGSIETGIVHSSTVYGLPFTRVLARWFTASNLCGRWTVDGRRKSVDGRRRVTFRHVGASLERSARRCVHRIGAAREARVAGISRGARYVRAGHCLSGSQARRGQG